jgi:hypothetical protein
MDYTNASDRWDYWLRRGEYYLVPHALCAAYPAQQ